jgi:hypothetical protein
MVKYIKTKNTEKVYIFVVIKVNGKETNILENGKKINEMEKVNTIFQMETSSRFI